MTPNYGKRTMAKRGPKRWTAEKGETADPTTPETPPEQEPQPEPEAPAAAETNPPEGETNPPTGEPAAPEWETAEPAEPTEPSEDEEEEEEDDDDETPEAGPLTKIQNAIRAVLDHDQLSEIRLALSARREDLKKHEKKGVELGVSEPDARFRLEILDGTSTKFGLTKIFAPLQASETRDLFFDREKPNGRPRAKDPTVENTTFTFRTVDGRDITCTGAQLRLAHILMDLRAMRVAGTLPEAVEVAFREMGFSHLIEDAKPAGNEPATETITFQTVDGRDVTCNVEQLEQLHLEDLRALHRAGIMPENVRGEVMAQDFWHLIDESEAAGQMAETAGVEG